MPLAGVKNGWYVLYTRVRHEKKVAERLSSMSIQSFLPTIKTLKMFASKKRYVHLPLFPSYVFVKLENAQHYFESLQVPGILSYVRVGTQLAAVSDAIIGKLNTITTFSQADVEVSGDRFDAGDVIDIHAGPFTGFSCEVIEYRGKHKILVRIDLLQRSILVDMPVCCLT